MCRQYFVRWVDSEGKPLLGAPAGFTFPDDAPEDSLPTCTCWIAGVDGDDAVWSRFTEMLRPLFDAPFSGWCRIEIEVL